MNESRKKTVDEILRGMGAEAPTRDNESLKQTLLNMKEEDFSELMSLGCEIAAIGLMLRGARPSGPPWRSAQGSKKRYGRR